MSRNVESPDPRPDAVGVDLLGAACAEALAAVFLVDAGGRCVAANAAAAQLAGYEPEELTALPPGALNAFPDEGATHRIEVTLQLRETGSTHLLRRDGSVVRVRFSATPTRVCGGPGVLTLCWPE